MWLDMGGDSTCLERYKLHYYASEYIICDGVAWTHPF